MYAKIVTLLALVIGSLSGLTGTSHSATRGNWTNSDNRPVESVHTHISQADPRNQPELRDDADDEHPAEETPVVEPLLGCHTTDTTTLNPEVESFAAQLGLSYEAVLSWYCSGYSFDTIQTVYDMSILAGVSTDDIYDLRVVEGYTWDEVIQELGITFSRNTPPMILDEADQSRSDR